MEKLASALDASTSSKWDLVSRTTFLPFERQVRNALTSNDLEFIFDHAPPTADDIEAMHPSLSGDALKAKISDKLLEYRTADSAAHAIIDKLIVWKKAPARLAEMAAIEKQVGYASGHELWKFIIKCRSCTSYQDQQRLKKELLTFKVAVGCSEDDLRTTLNDLYQVWLMIKGNDESMPTDLYETALNALPTDESPELEAYVGSVRALMHVQKSDKVLWEGWSDFLDTLVEKYKGLKCCGQASKRKLVRI